MKCVAQLWNFPWSLAQHGKMPLDVCVALMWCPPCGVAHVFPMERTDDVFFSWGCSIGLCSVARETSRD